MVSVFCISERVNNESMCKKKKQTWESSVQSDPELCWRKIQQRNSWCHLILQHGREPHSGWAPPQILPPTPPPINILLTTLVTWLHHITAFFWNGIVSLKQILLLSKMDISLGDKKYLSPWCFLVSLHVCNCNTIHKENTRNHFNYFSHSSPQIPLGVLIHRFMLESMPSVRLLQLLVNRLW